MKNILTNEPYICTVAARAGVGKTSFIVMMANEKIKQGKGVLYLTFETPSNIILNKFRKIVPNDLSVKLRVFRYTYHEKVKEKIESLLFNNHYDLVIIDDSSFIDKDELLKVLQYLNSEKGVSVIVSCNSHRSLPDSFTSIRPSMLLNISDYVYSLETKTNMSFFERLKHLVLFWTPTPNRVLKLIKNRHGKEESFNLSIDFQNLKLN